MRIIKSFSLIILIGVAALTITSAKAATLNVDGGKLLGATGVVVAGFGTFDVAFLDGSCSSLFSPCNVSQFIGDGDVAFVAGNALLSQVLTGDFDADPGLTNGCNDTAFCEVLVPHAVSSSFVSFFKVFNASDTSGFTDGVFSSGASTGFDTTGEDGFVYAVFTAAPVSAVPLPPAALLFGTALVGLVGISRRRRQANRG